MMYVLCVILTLAAALAGFMVLDKVSTALEDRRLREENRASTLRRLDNDAFELKIAASRSKCRLDEIEKTLKKPLTKRRKRV